MDRYNDDLNQVMTKENNSSYFNRAAGDFLDQEDEQVKKDAEKKRKKDLLKEQKRKRQEKEAEAKLKELVEQEKKELAMRKLNEQLAKNKVENLKRQEELRQLKELEARKKQLEKELRLQERREKFAKRVKNPLLNGDSGGGVVERQNQILELHDWIDEQIEHVQRQSSQDVEEASPPRVKEVKVSAKKDGLKASTSSNIYQTKENVNSSKKLNSSGLDLEDVVDPEFSKSFSQQDYVPGNNELDFQEYQKLGQRQNRYGIFGDNGYRDKISRRPPAQLVKEDPVPILSREGIQSAFSQIELFHLKKLEQHIQKQQELSFSNTNIISAQQQPLPQPRRILNEIHRQYMLNFHPTVEEATSNNPQAQSVPGVVNIQSELQRQQREELGKKTKASIVIQKWARGMFARRTVRRLRQTKQSQIEAQHGYFQRRVKDNYDYNLNKYLRDKEVLREKNKTKSVRVLESSSIVEQIEGMSSSLIQRVPIISKVAQYGYQSKDRRTKQNQETSLRVNNFIVPQASYDPHSIVNIFVKQHQPVPAVVQSPVKLLSQSKGRDTNATSKERAAASIQQKPEPPKKSSKEAVMQKKHPQRRVSHSSEIEEDIIPEDIPVPKTDESLSRQSSIDEDIVDEVGSSHNKAASNSDSIKEELPNLKESFKQLRSHKPFAYRLQHHDSMSQSIKEDILVSVDNRGKSSPYKGKHHGSGSYEDSSIAEESHLNQGISASKASSNGHKKFGSGAIEESINESVPSGGNQSDSSSLIVQPPKNQMFSKPQQQQSLRAQHETEKEKTMEQIRKFEEDRKASADTKQRLVSEMLHELNRYESANVSEVVLERMEKVITKSLAQKDQLMVAQSLHELELKAKHQEEIVRIREEQVKLLAQLMIAQGGSITEKQRKEMYENIQKIVEKPVHLVAVSHTHSHSDPNSRSQEDSSKIKQSTSYKESQSIKDSLKLDIVEESGLEKDRSDIDEDIPEDFESKGALTSSEEIKESMHPGQESSSSVIPEESHLANMRKVIGSEKDIRSNSKKVIGKGETAASKKESGVFNRNSFNEFQEKKFRDFLSNDDFYEKVQQQLEQYKEQAYKELDNELKRNLITPRTHRKKGEEIEKWADRKSRDLIKQVEPLNLQFKSIIDNLKKDKESIIEKIGVCPRRQVSRSKDEISSSIDYEEVEEEQSDESSNTRFLRDQINKLALKDNFMGDQLDASESAKLDLKIKKKKALAKKLVEEKERLIKQGMKDKLRSIEADQAEKMVNLALKLDPSKEIEKRLREMSRRVDESSEQLESARSMGLSQSGVPSEYKKKVQFASPEKYRSSGKDDDVSSVSLKQSNKFEDSIQESLPLQDSYSQSFPNPSSSSHIELKKPSLKPTPIKEEVFGESQNYSEDFEESKGEHRIPSKDRLTNYDRSGTESEYIEEEQDILSGSQSIQQSRDFKPMIIVVQDPDGQTTSNKVVDQVPDNNTVSGYEIPNEKTTSDYESSMAAPQPDQESEDQEVVVSSASIQWEIDMKKKLSTESYQEDFIEEDLNTKRSQQSKEREQDSESLNEDSEEELINMADAFTEEYIEILIKEIEEIDQYRIGEILDEESFQGKFPFNQIEPEPLPEVKPPISASPSPKAPVVNVPSPEEIARQKYEADLQKLNQNFEENIRFIDLVIENIDRRDLIATLEKPIEVDPLKKLSQILAHEGMEDSALINDTLNDSNLLNLNFYVKVEIGYNRRFPQTEEENAKARELLKFHHKALFDAFNEALDLERPYKDKGQPMPWSKQTRIIKKELTNDQVEKMLNSAKERVISWCKIGAGTRLAPPPAPKNDQIHENENNPAPQQTPSEEDPMHALRQQRMDKLIVQCQLESEPKWLDFEDDEASIKLDLADMILDKLAIEVTEFLHKKSDNRR